MIHELAEKQEATERFSASKFILYHFDGVKPTEIGEFFKKDMLLSPMFYVQLLEKPMAAYRSFQIRIAPAMLALVVNPL